MSTASSASHATAANVSQRAEKLASEAGVRLARTTKAAATRSLEMRRKQAEAYIGDAARAIDAAADQLVRDEHELTAHYVRAVACQSRHIASLVDPKDLRTMVGQAEDFIRRRPVVSTIAALTLGFAAMQAMRAAPQDNAPGRRGHGK